MKVLHFVKTSDGARWACEMVEQLILKGVDVIVVLPDSKGKMIPAWKKTGARLIFEYTEMPVKKMWTYYRIKKKVEEIIHEVQPDIIHAHFFSQIVLLRNIKFSKTRIFQVPGPLHLENRMFKFWDILSAKKNDKWIASSKYILNLYMKSGLSEKRVGLSYYGNHLQAYSDLDENLRKKYKIAKNSFIVGNLSYFYAPKAYLFQRVGLKGHELFIKVLSKCKIRGIVFGKQFGVSQSYYDKVKSRAPESIIFAGGVEPFEVSKAWKTMDLCLHLPLSENCGGVVEPLLHSVPVITCNTGGLSEVIINKKTGLLVDRNEESIKDALTFAKENPKHMQEYAINGQKLVLAMFDVKRTSEEILRYYERSEDFGSVEKFNSEELL